MHQQHFILQTQFLAHFCAGTPWEARLKKIVDDINRAVKIEDPLRFPLQKFRHGRHCIRMGQRVMDGRTITRIGTQQRGIRAMQRGDDPWLLFRRQH